MKKLKIGYFADGPWGHNALLKLLEDETIEFGFIVPRNDTTDTFLKNKAKEFGIDYLCPVKVNSDDFYEVAQKYACDLFVSMSYNQIFHRRIYNLPPLKTINCHAGQLPRYRGRNILNWALINDEKEFGITVHYVDDGIDTGDIILQRTYPIKDEDNYNTLLEIAYKECPDILYQAIKEIQNGIIHRIPQATISQHGLYCGMRSLGDEIIDMNSTSRELFNFVRAICKPGPRAVAYLNGTPVYINKVIYNPDFPKYKGTNGQIVGKIDGMPILKTKDSYVLIEEFESEAKLKTGVKLTGK